MHTEAPLTVGFHLATFHQSAQNIIGPLRIRLEAATSIRLPTDLLGGDKLSRPWLQIVQYG